MATEKTIVRAGRHGTIVEAEELRQALLARICDAGTDMIEIDLSTVEDADVTLLQLILSAEIFARTKGRSLSVASSPAVNELMSRAGLAGRSALSGA